MSDADTRLGRNGADEVKEHPYFKGIDWANIRSSRAPNIPSVASEISPENFDKIDENEIALEEAKANKLRGVKGKSKRMDTDFIGYTYKGDVE